MPDPEFDYGYTIPSGTGNVQSHINSAADVLRLARQAVDDELKRRINSAGAIAHHASQHIDNAIRATVNASRAVASGVKSAIDTVASAHTAAAREYLTSAGILPTQPTGPGGGHLLYNPATPTATTDEGGGGIESPGPGTPYLPGIGPSDLVPGQGRPDQPPIQPSDTGEGPEPGPIEPYPPSDIGGGEPPIFPGYGTGIGGPNFSPPKYPGGPGLPPYFGPVRPGYPPAGSTGGGPGTTGPGQSGPGDVVPLHPSGPGLPPASGPAGGSDLVSITVGGNNYVTTVNNIATYITNLQEQITNITNNINNISNIVNNNIVNNTSIDQSVRETISNVVNDTVNNVNNLSNVSNVENITNITYGGGPPPPPPAGGAIQAPGDLRPIGNVFFAGIDQLENNRIVDYYGKFFNDWYSLATPEDTDNYINRVKQGRLPGVEG